MKRLGVIAIYDKVGKIDTYIDYLISSMSKISHKLVVIINGSIQKEDYARIHNYSFSNIYQRKLWI